VICSRNDRTRSVCIEGHHAEAASSTIGAHKCTQNLNCRHTVCRRATRALRVGLLRPRLVVWMRACSHIACPLEHGELRCEKCNVEDESARRGEERTHPNEDIEAAGGGRTPNLERRDALECLAQA
jgi:hypothetical protein